MCLINWDRPLRGAQVGGEGLCFAHHCACLVRVMPDTRVVLPSAQCFSPLTWILLIKQMLICEVGDGAWESAFMSSTMGLRTTSWVLQCLSTSTFLILSSQQYYYTNTLFKTLPLFFSLEPHNIIARRQSVQILWFLSDRCWKLRHTQAKWFVWGLLVSGRTEDFGFSLAQWFADLSMYQNHLEGL